MSLLEHEINNIILFLKSMDPAILPRQKLIELRKMISFLIMKTEEAEEIFITPDDKIP